MAVPIKYHAFSVAEDENAYIAAIYEFDEIQIQQQTRAP
jgi:hypothetical protein